MNIRFFRRAICAVTLAATLCALQSMVVHQTSAVGQSASQQNGRYNVYCVDGKVNISNRELNDLKSTRSRVCLLESFDSLSKAMRAAKRYGGVGASCSCPR
jgi:hypothetical protein